jgi:exodeoxyribonuclease V gamma subunit
MGMELVVANDLETLADRLVEFLSESPSDPFKPDSIVIPGDGVRSWLTHAIATRMGICSNINFSYPAKFLRTTFDLESKLGLWETGPLTWAIHAIQKEDGVDDLLRARAIADVFDRYILYRPHMVRRWSDGENVDGALQALADHHCWQPELWRRLEARIGRSDARTFEELARNLSTDLVEGESLPERVFVFGLTTMPQPQLDLFRLLSSNAEVSLFAPASSLARWESVRTRLGEELRFPVLRDGHQRSPAGFRLNEVWGRTNEEGHTLLVDTVNVANGVVAGPLRDEQAATSSERSGLLSSLQNAIARDQSPDDAVAPDHSVVIHRTFGATRQVEVLRDHLLHLFNERQSDGTAVFEPRDVVVLTHDVERFAPLVQAVFAGSPEAGLPEIPVQIADRSLGVTNPIASVGQQLLRLLDRRFRVTDVVELLAQPVVGHHFDLEPIEVERVSELLISANARWGLDEDDQRAVGIEPLGSFTLIDALHRLIAAVATSSTGPELVGGRIAASPGVSFDDVGLLGKTVIFVQTLHDSCERLRQPAAPQEWFTIFRQSLRHLVSVHDDEVFWWRAIDRLFDDLHDELRLAGEPSSSVVSQAADLSVLLSSRLSASKGSARFDTGRVTMSSFTALRGVPHRVVCLLGIDREGEPSALGNPDDLTQSPQCIGDRDSRSEHQAQLLDAVMSAQERLIVCSTGFDIRTGAEVSPPAALSELADALGELAGHPFPMVDHPRQTWSEKNFVVRPEVSDRPWSHDRSAVEAAIARRYQREDQLKLPLLRELQTGPVAVADLRDALSRPVRTFCDERLHLATFRETDREFSSNIPLSLDGLDRFALRHGMMSAALQGGQPEDWVAFLVASGDVPPGVYGAASLQQAQDESAAIVSALTSDGIELPLVTTSHDVRLGETATAPGVSGAVDSLYGAILLDIAASSSFADRFCERLIDLIVLSVWQPETSWQLSMYRAGTTKAPVRHITASLRTAATPNELLDLVLRFRQEVLSRPVPLFPRVALAHCCSGKPKSEWEGEQHRPGEREQLSHQLFFDLSYEELVDKTTFSHEINTWFAPIVRSFDITDSAGELHSIDEVSP